MKKSLFWISYVIAGICFLLAIVAFVIGFIQHMHDAGGFQAVFKILETPITGFIKLTNGYIQKSTLEIIILIIVSYILPAYFVVMTMLLKRKREQGY
ncbi:MULTISPECIES: hypothetical protein [Listeria]|uniref:hypothetical protein n=1 Tax=Listeria TaxID=1637 RepID=UPI000B592197|nr:MULTISPECIES: hypothetical protein [Listeria]